MSCHIALRARTVTAEAEKSPTEPTRKQIQWTSLPAHSPNPILHALPSQKGKTCPVKITCPSSNKAWLTLSVPQALPFPVAKVRPLRYEFHF